MTKRLIAILLALVLALSLAACGTSAAEPENTAPANDQPEGQTDGAGTEETVEITFWHSYSEGEEKIFHDTVLKAFNERYPNIKVNVIKNEVTAYVGAKNYLDLFRNKNYLLAFQNTSLYTLVTVPGQMFFGLVLACLINSVRKGQTMFKVICYLPVITSWVVVSLVFKYLFMFGKGGLMKEFNQKSVLRRGKKQTKIQNKSGRGVPTIQRIIGLHKQKRRVLFDVTVLEVRG